MNDTVAVVPGLALLPVADRQVDQLTVLSRESSEPFDLYFDVTIPMTAMTLRSEHEAEPPRLWGGERK